MKNKTLLKPLQSMKTTQVLTSIDKTKIMQPGGYERPKMPFLSATQERGEGQTGSETISQPIVTIDDLEALAQQLLAGIEILKSYKYPLAVRRGVKHS
jgi:hypothetical protein